MGYLSRCREFGGGPRVSARAEGYQGVAAEDAILTSVPAAPLSLAISLNAPPSVHPIQISALEVDGKPSASANATTPYRPRPRIASSIDDPPRAMASRMSSSSLPHAAFSSWPLFRDQNPPLWPTRRRPASTVARVPPSSPRNAPRRSAPVPRRASTATIRRALP